MAWGLTAPCCLTARFGGKLTGRAGLPQLADSFVSDPARHFAVGQSVRAQVVQVSPCCSWRHLAGFTNFGI